MLIFFTAKSPYKLSTTEKRVIGGLKQLTELLFKEHYKQNAKDQKDTNEPLKSDEMETNVDYPSSSGANMYANKENTDGNVKQIEDNVPDESGGAEVFCGMVVQQLTTGESKDHTEEWHHGQLNAYNWAHEKLFQKK